MDKKRMLLSVNLLMSCIFLNGMESGSGVGSSSFSNNNSLSGENKEQEVAPWCDEWQNKLFAQEKGQDYAVLRKQLLTINMSNIKRIEFKSTEFSPEKYIARFLYLSHITVERDINGRVSCDLFAHWGDGLDNLVFQYTGTHWSLPLSYFSKVKKMYEEKFKPKPMLINSVTNETIS